MKSLTRIAAGVLLAALVSADFDRPVELLETGHFIPTAEARIGHPLTPLSYAGVARRTARRVARRTAIRLNALPHGCVYGNYYGAYYYNCGGVYYQQSGGVYVQVIIE
jgi:hypothetical protein